MSFTADLNEIVAENRNGRLGKHPSWSRTRLDDVADVLNGFPFDSKKFDATSGIPLVRIRDVVRGTTKTFFNGEAPEGFWIDEGQILIGMDGDFNAALWKGPRALLNQRVLRLKSRNQNIYDETFLFHAISGYLQAINENTPSVTVKHLSSKTVQSVPLPLPPIAEQRRIAQKLDALLAQVDTLKARIDAIPFLLKRFRSAVLSAATNGELTGEKPYCWKALPLEGLVESSMVGLVRSSNEQLDQLDGLHPYLKMNNINQDWGFNTDNVVGVRATKEELLRYELKRGDWLFNTRNSLELVGKSCVWHGPKGFVFNNNILRIRFVAEALPEYVEIWFRSPQGRAGLNKIKSATTSVAAIYQKALMKEVLLLPEISQQRKIVQRVEQLFAFADQIEARVNAVKDRVDALTQSLLAKAFRGELVPQDPNDEPASVLLERIRAQRAAAPKPKRGRKAAAS